MKQDNITNGIEVHQMENLDEMKEEYDFSNAKKNPYAKKLRQQVTINLDSSIIDYFKEMSAASGVPYQTLINLYLSDCVKSRRKLHISWQ